jgi:hypothetical protein
MINKKKDDERLWAIKLLKTCGVTSTILTKRGFVETNNLVTNFFIPISKIGFYFVLSHCVNKFKVHKCQI